MKNLLLAILVALLACACNHKPKPELLVLLVDARNKQQDTVQIGVLHLDDEGVPRGILVKSCRDTIIINTARPYLELSLGVRISKPNTKSWQDIGGGDFILFQTGDTVEVSYTNEGYGIYRSRRSAQQTALYSRLTQPTRWLSDSACYLKSDLFFPYLNQIKQEQDPSFQWPERWNRPDSLIKPFWQQQARYNKMLDSLQQNGSLPEPYSHYYRYRLRQLEVYPTLTQRLVNYRRSNSMAQLRPLLNDSLLGYISYWYFLSDLKVPLVSASYEKYVPNLTDETKHNYVKDERKIFDVLSTYKDSIPPRTLNLLRYSCVDRMRSIGTNFFSTEDQMLYAMKYRAITTDFLDTVPNKAKQGADKLAGTPFRFFVFLIEFAACTFAVLFLYRRWLRKRMGLVTRRIYLLLGLAVSILLPLFTIAPQLRVVEKTEYWSTIVSPISAVLFCIYLLGCCVLLYEMVCWLWQVEKMRRNSWRIPDKRYTLCVLMDIESKPTIFGRKIFVSWNDWWSSKDKLARERILDSERYRVEHWHTFDSLLLAVVRIGCWGNPLLYCYNKELQLANDMAASNHVYCNRTTMIYEATEEARELHSELIMGLAASDAEQKSKPFTKWISNVKYQLLILLAVFIIVAIFVELVGTISKLSDTSFF